MRVAIYSRKSLETDKGDSIKNQIEICKEYFLRRNDNVEFEIFEDEGFSGGNTNRPAFQLMLKRIKGFDAIACYKIDRIARNVVDFVNIYSSLDKLDVKLISVTEGFDPGTPIGKMIMMILASFAEMERLNIAQRVKDNMKELAKSGKWTGGNVPYGYIAERIEENSKKATYLKLDESKIDLIKNIFKYYIETQSMHQVQKWLYENDIKWCMSTIKNILTSPIYAKSNKAISNYLANFGEVFGTPDMLHGIISYNRRPYSNGKHRWNDKSMFYSVSKHNGIIEPDIWLKVQSMQEKNKTDPRPKKSQISYLTTVLRCGKCGSPMTVSYNHKNKNGDIAYVYLCTGRKSYGVNFCNSSQIKQELFDKKFKEKLSFYASLSFDEFKKVLGHNDIPVKKNDIKSVQKKIVANTNKINNLVDKLAELSNSEGAPFMAKVKTLTKENEELKIKLLLMQQEELNSNPTTLEFVYDQIKAFLAVFDNLDLNLKREYIRGFIKMVSYNSDSMNAEIEFL